MQVSASSLQIFSPKLGSTFHRSTFLLKMEVRDKTTQTFFRGISSRLTPRETAWLDMVSYIGARIYEAKCCGAVEGNLPRSKVSWRSTNKPNAVLGRG